MFATPMTFLITLFMAILLIAGALILRRSLRGSGAGGARWCDQCQARNPVRARFCSRCGGALPPDET